MILVIYNQIDQEMIITKYLLTLCFRIRIQNSAFFSTQIQIYRSPGVEGGIKGTNGEGGIPTILLSTSSPNRITDSPLGEWIGQKSQVPLFLYFNLIVITDNLFERCRKTELSKKVTGSFIACPKNGSIRQVYYYRYLIFMVRSKFSILLHQELTHVHLENGIFLSRGVFTVAL